MEFFTQYKTIIFRSVGALMLLVGFAVHFWSTPQKGISENDRAAANVARMEAKVKGSSTSHNSKSNESIFLQEFKNKQAKQMEYLTILVMILGVGFLGYSFIKKK